MIETLSEIHSCISLIDQAARPHFNLPAEVGDFAFQLCNMGGALVSLKGLNDRIGQPVDFGLFNEPRWNNTEHIA